ncbi:hypothetical protein [Salipiger mucosus]|uniref:hypothetical protein n=1 Tax=Salipiger mucosus TaxID=263378 RepID=UPI0012EC5E84|nr:hypothetical protein [Salipiger mucosus]
MSSRHKRFFDHLGRILCLGTMCQVLFPPYSASASPLTSEDCHFVELYDEHEGEGEFATLVSDMLHADSGCVAGKECPTALRKRTKPFSVTFDSGNPQNLRGLYAVNVAYTLEFIRKFSGLAAGANLPSEAGENEVHVIITGTEVAAHNTEAPEQLRNFYEQDELTCAVANFGWHDSGDEYSEIWLKGSLPEPKFGDCIKQSMYEATGFPGVPDLENTMLGDGIFSGRKLGHPLYDGLSMRERIVMLIAFTPELENGQSQRETLQDVKRIIREACRE